MRYIVLGKHHKYVIVIDDDICEDSVEDKISPRKLTD